MTRPIARAAALAVSVLATIPAFSNGCARDDSSAKSLAAVPVAKPADGGSVRAVVLPDLSRAASSVQEQLRDRYASLMRTIEKPGATKSDLGNAYGEMGKLFMAAEYLDAAETCYLNAQMLMPNEVRWPYYLGHLHKKRDALARAAASFERALELNAADPAALVWLGDVYLDQGRPDAAAPLFAKAHALHTRSAAALYGLGRAALAKKDYALAVKHLEEALAVDKRASIIHYPLAMAYRGRGELGKAEAHLRQRGDVEIAPPDPLMEELSVLLESAMSYQSRGIHALENGQYQAAAEYFRRGIELEPQTASLHHRLGTALFLMGDPRGAVEGFETALRLAPEFSKAHYSLGAVLAWSGRYEDAIERFSAAVKYEPQYVEAHVVLADTLRGTGRWEAALGHYDQVLKLDPRVAEARLGYAMTLVGLRRYRAAHEQLIDAARIHSDRPEFAHALARLWAAAPEDRIRDGRRAMEAMQELLKGPRSMELLETMAMTLAEIGKFGEAAAWQREAIAEATSTGHGDLARRMRANLALYESRRPCRTPWRSGELP